ncbi:transcriptional regulator [Thermoproteus sp. CP80]|uniref:GyrI-like domain-containing protein n=1 Tax=Thermoproteus sp. CP80 TaxID=1650659 RepID=UPI0009BDB577|nr:GyrI-like domain-containing protein [Thermoproteus sp. CP80]PLC66931.1 transcriptional regulator [Thermoproteus sp. CP80]
MPNVEVKEVGEVRGFSVLKEVPNRSALAQDLKPGTVLVFHGKQGANMLVEIFTPDPSGDKVLNGGKMAVYRFAGSSDKVDNAYAAILFWALNNGASPGSPTREVYLKVDKSQTPPEVEVEVQVPI